MDRPAKIIVALVAIAVIAFFVFTKLSGWHKDKMDTAVRQEQNAWQNKTDKLEEEITALKEELTVVKGQKVPEKKLAEVFGEEPKQAEKGAEPSAEKKPGLADIERQIMAFFTYLNGRPYVQALKLEGGTYHQYQIGVEKLSSHLPINTGEMDSLYNMVRNVAHFYRVLGKQRVLLTKQILQNEPEVIESVMQTFYQWFTMDDEGKAALEGRPSLEVQYEYAGYLLNTLGGRSYLLRRSPRVRTLTAYYCVLILDKANDAGLNSRGIDIRPYIKSTLNEIENQIGLIYQKAYIAKLNELRLKYP